MRRAEEAGDRMTGDDVDMRRVGVCTEAAGEAREASDMREGGVAEAAVVVRLAGLDGPDGGGKVRLRATIAAGSAARG